MLILLLSISPWNSVDSVVPGVLKADDLKTSATWWRWLVTLLDEAKLLFHIELLHLLLSHDHVL